MKPKLLLPGLFIHAFTCLHAADNLRIGDIRSIGMGGNEATSSALFNPSLIALHERKTVRLNYFNRYALKELGTVCGSFYVPDALIPAGFDVSSFGYDAYRESMLRFLAAKRLSSRWALGISVQYGILQTELFEEQPQRLSTDIGLTYIPVDNLLISALIMNLPSVSFGYEPAGNNVFMPYLIQAGFQWAVINGVLISAALAAGEDSTINASLGIEYAPLEDFSIRAGVKGAPALPAFGAGYRFSDFDMDVAAVYHPVLGVSAGIGISFNF